MQVLAKMVIFFILQMGKLYLRAFSINQLASRYQIHTCPEGKASTNAPDKKYPNSAKVPVKVDPENKIMSVALASSCPFTRTSI